MTHSPTRRLKSVKGQLDGIIKMIDDDKPCAEVLVQFRAARAGLAGAVKIFIEERMHECLLEGKLGKEKQAELSQIITELTK